jgi:hypothetical protein
MKREKLKRLLTTAAFVLFFCLSVSGQESSRKIILEVYKSSFGMTAEVGKHLFVRVRGNGRVEYRTPVIENNKRKYKLRKYRLSAEKLRELKDFLNNPKVARIAAEYSPDVTTLDHIIGFDITIRHQTKTQSIRLTNFEPNLRKAEAVEHPPELIELVCRLDALRSRTGFWLLKNDCVLNPKERIERIVTYSDPAS